MGGGGDERRPYLRSGGPQGIRWRAASKQVTAESPGRAAPGPPPPGPADGGTIPGPVSTEATETRHSEPHGLLFSGPRTQATQAKANPSKLLLWTYIIVVEIMGCFYTNIHFQSNLTLYNLGLQPNQQTLTPYKHTVTH